MKNDDLWMLPCKWKVKMKISFAFIDDYLTKRLPALNQRRRCREVGQKGDEID